MEQPIELEWVDEARPAVEVTSVMVAAMNSEVVEVMLMLSLLVVAVDSEV